MGLGRGRIRGAAVAHRAGHADEEHDGAEQEKAEAPTDEAKEDITEEKDARYIPVDIDVDQDENKDPHATPRPRPEPDVQSDAKHTRVRSCRSTRACEGHGAG